MIKNFRKKIGAGLLIGALTYFSATSFFNHSIQLRNIQAAVLSPPTSAGPAILPPGPLTVNFGAPVGANKLLVAVVASEANSFDNDVLAGLDSNSLGAEVWNTAVETNFGVGVGFPNGFPAQGIYYRISNGDESQFTLTLASSAPDETYFQVFVYDGVDTAAPFIDAGSNSGSLLPPVCGPPHTYGAISSGTANPLSNGDLVFAHFTMSHGGVSLLNWSDADGFTQLTSKNDTTGSYGNGERIVPAGGAYSVTVDPQKNAGACPVFNADWVGQIVSFRQLVPPSSDLSITKTAAATAYAGDNVTYTLLVTNNGPDATSGVITVTDVLPAGTSFVSASGAGWACGYAPLPSTVTCTSSTSLPNAGSSTPISLVLAMPSSGTTVTNTAHVAHTNDGNAANNDSLPSSVDLKALQQAGYEWYANMIGKSVNSSLTGNIQNVQAVIEVPSQNFRLRMLFHNKGKDITAGLATDLRYRLQFGEKPVGGCNAAVFSDMTNSSSPLRFANNAGGGDDDSLVAATLPATDPIFAPFVVVNQTFNDTDGGLADDPNRFAESANILHDQVGMWDFVLGNDGTAITPAKTYCFRAVREDATQLVANTALHIYPELQLGASGDLQITKSVLPTSGVPGTSVTYTIVASNPTGPSNVTGATVTENFPVTITNANWTCAAVGSGSACGAASGSGNISETVNVGVDGTVTYTVTAQISSGASGTVSNVASITAPASFTDPNLANNTTVPANFSVTPAGGGGLGGGGGSGGGSGPVLSPPSSTTPPPPSVLPATVPEDDLHGAAKKRQVMIENCHRDERDLFPFLDSFAVGKPVEWIRNVYMRCIVDGRKLWKIAQGNFRGYFEPDDFTTRAEAVKIAINSFYPEFVHVNSSGFTELETTPSQVFDDVPVSHWFYPWASFAVEHEMIKHDADHRSFHPDDYMTRAEALTVMLRASGTQVPVSVRSAAFLDVDRADWYNSYVAYGQRQGVLQGVVAEASRDIPETFRQNDQQGAPTEVSRPESTQPAEEVSPVPETKPVYSESMIRSQFGEFRPNEFIIRTDIAKIVSNLL